VTSYSIFTVVLLSDSHRRGGEAMSLVKDTRAVGACKKKVGRGGKNLVWYRNVLRIVFLCRSGEEKANGGERVRVKFQKRKLFL
jgi:hypothetical protein